FLLVSPPPAPRSTLFPYTTLFRSLEQRIFQDRKPARGSGIADGEALFGFHTVHASGKIFRDSLLSDLEDADAEMFSLLEERENLDRKSTRLNSSHDQISYAVFCLK